jgi:hypothetical protein
MISCLTELPLYRLIIYIDFVMHTFLVKTCFGLPFFQQIINFKCVIF